MAPEEAATGGMVEVDALASELRNGQVVFGQAGVIEFGWMPDPDNQPGLFVHDCTGIMIGPHHALTAAHCTGRGRQRFPRGTTRAAVRYFDPVLGVRFVTPSGIATLDVEVPEEWGGLFMGAESDEIDPENDIGVVHFADGWDATSSADWAWFSASTPSRFREVRFFGAGFSDNAGNGSGTLRRTTISIEDFDSRIVESDATSVAICEGDSGGPYLGPLDVGGQGGPAAWVVFAVQSTTADRDGRRCAEPGQYQRGTRINVDRMHWISGIVQGHTGSPCTLGDSTGRCF